MDPCYYSTAAAGFFALMFVASEVLAHRARGDSQRPRSLADALRRTASMLSLRSRSRPPSPSPSP